MGPVGGWSFGMCLWRVHLSLTLSLVLCFWPACGAQICYTRHFHHIFALKPAERGLKPLKTVSPIKPLQPPLCEYLVLWVTKQFENTEVENEKDIWGMRKNEIQKKEQSETQREWRPREQYNKKECWWIVSV